jgi:hypothetical protein
LSCVVLAVGVDEATAPLDAGAKQLKEQITATATSDLAMPRNHYPSRH